MHPSVFSSSDALSLVDPGGWCRPPDDDDAAAERMTSVAKHLLLKNMVSGAFAFRVLQMVLTFVFLGLFAFVVLYQADSTNMEDSVSTVSGYAILIVTSELAERGRPTTLETSLARSLCVGGARLV